MEITGNLKAGKMGFEPCVFGGGSVSRTIAGYDSTD